MSRIYFHSPSEEAEVRGSERAYAGVLCGDIFSVVAGLYGHNYEDPPLRQFVKAGHYTLSVPTERFNASLRTAIVTGDEGVLVVDGQSVSVFGMLLNTAYRLGGDTLKLLARLHGQCEIHCYVSGENRKWLAGLITDGRASGILRAEQGWESVAEMLLRRDDEDVVTSYSVCEQFPNAGVAGWGDDQDGDGWYELPDEEQWARSMKVLKENKGLELTPENWNTFYFNDGFSGFELMEKAYA